MVRKLAKSAPKGKHAAPRGAGALWGGHFSHGPADAFAAINPSIVVDQRMWREDIEGSIAHATMLASQRIITTKESVAIIKGLKQIAREIETGALRFSEELEDIHLNIESRLKVIIGDAAGKLHTGRSRNDQVATDLRVYARNHAGRILESLRALQASLLSRAEDHTDTIMPGMTHLQPAQPVSFAFHLLAYVAMFGRDRARLEDALVRMNASPLGSAALAGTSYPIDREKTATALGFDAACENAMDGVSDRDYALEIMAALSIISMHLSRLSEELIFWSNPLAGFITLHESFTSGSSIMPQKRNADAAELIRGKSSHIAAAFSGLLGTLKALPLAYNKDMQEDKRAFFFALDETELCLAAMRGMIDTLSVNKTAMRAACNKGYINATDLADFLVQKHGVAFREAHHITGRIVKRAEAKGVGLEDLPLADMRKEYKTLDAKVHAFIAMDACMARRNSAGGTAPKQVRAAIKTARSDWL